MEDVGLSAGTSAAVHVAESASSQATQVLAKALADLMQPGEMHYRRGVGIHAFQVDDVLCLAAAYLEEERDGHRYRYAVLCGGEAAKRALNTADLDQSDSDAPGSPRGRDARSGVACPGG